MSAARLRVVVHEKDADGVQVGESAGESERGVAGESRALDGLMGQI